VGERAYFQNKQSPIDYTRIIRFAHSYGIGRNEIILSRKVQFKLPSRGYNQRSLNGPIEDWTIIYYNFWFAESQSTIAQKLSETSYN